MSILAIYETVEQAIQDPSFTREGSFIPLINQAMNEISVLVALPLLQTSAVLNIPVDATTGYVDMPENYHRDMYYAKELDSGRDLRIRANMRTLYLLNLPEQAQIITDCVVYAGEFHFAPQPLTENNIQILYYRNFEPLEDEDEDQDIDGLPVQYYDVVSNYLLKKLFAIIEDGVDGRKVNTAFYNEMYMSGLAKISTYCLESPKKNPLIVRKARFF